MSSKRCSRCEKTVYPLEEIKCLDKTWHKLCFKCQECGSALNMKTYKGFNKQPYCSAHCPQAKHTAVADTPEARRLAENTRIQSQVKYHEDFEKQKGKLTQVADDPETLRIKNTSKIISNVAYHGDIEKKKQMEQRRMLVPETGSNGFTNNADGNQVSGPSPTRAFQEKIMDIAPEAPVNSPYTSKLSSTVIYTSQEGPVYNSPSKRIGSIADYDPVNDNYGSVGAAYTTRTDSSHKPQHFYGGGGGETIPQVSPTSPNRLAGRVFRAMYDYTALDSDEVSFMDGDIIVNCTPIDEGWMTGMVQRTGHTGMLPANYVEPIN